MIPPDFTERAFSSLGLPETVAMILGGFLFGAFVIWLSPTVSSGETSIRYAGLVFALAGLIFFIGRGFALYFDGSNLWPRNVGFSVLWLVYCASMSLGIAARKRLT